jgi:hypothetical protein
MARWWWLLTVLAGACSNGNKSSSQPAAWLSITLSEPAGERQCSGAAPTPYDFGSEAKPLIGQESCTVHSGEKDSWISGHLAESRTSAGGNNVVFTIDTEQGLSLELVSDTTATLTLDPNAAANCVPTFTTIIGNATTVEFDCPLLVDPNDPTSGCGVRGSVSFENCAIQ